MTALPIPLRWSPGQDKTLRKLAAEGWPASEIGRVLGKTRNAIIGRATRQKVTLGSARGTTNQRHKKCDGGANMKAERHRKNYLSGNKTDRAMTFQNPRRFVLGRGPAEAEAKPELGIIGRVLDPATAPQGALMVALEDLQADMCRWPFEVVDGNAKNLTRFCGCATAEDSSWCAAHKRRATIHVSIEEIGG